jgi:hypothetical protein
VTLLLFQPLEFGAGVRLPLMVGGVLSSLIVIVFDVSALPTLSVPKKVIVVMPSVLMLIEVDGPASVVLAMDWAPEEL